LGVFFDWFFLIFRFFGVKKRKSKNRKIPPKKNQKNMKKTKNKIKNAKRKTIKKITCD